MVTDGCTWEESASICRKLDGALAKITSSSEVNSSISKMEGIEGEVAFYIGLKNEVDMIKL